MSSIVQSARDRLSAGSCALLSAGIVLVLIICAGLAFVTFRIILDDDDPGPVVDGTPTGTEGGDPGVVIRLDSQSSPELAAAGSGGAARLQISLSKGQEVPQAVQDTPLAGGDPLTDGEIQAILDRLPDLIIEADDRQDFNLPDSPIPPPRTGETIEQPFPPPPDSVSSVSPPSGPLQVLRFAPEGEIPLAPFLNVTFNQPMVPLTTLEELAAADVPVNLSPNIPGTWKWIGTKTLTFEAASDDFDRFPMATEYVAEVPAGTESATGGTLGEPVTWRFSTPPPQMVSYYPTSSAQPLDPLIFVAFDQSIDPEAVLSSIQVTAGGEQVATRLASSEDVKNDERVSRLADNYREGRWLAFRAAQPFQPDTSVSVVVGPGTPSAEGPLVTTEAQSFGFSTYAPLRITGQNCGRSDRDCRPLSSLSIYFNNPIDPDSFTEGLLTIDPPLPGATMGLFDSTLTIKGPTEGRTTYEVTVDGSIEDIFGQTLGEDERVRFRIGSAPKALIGPDSNMITLDPSAETPVLTIYSINYDRLEVKAYAVEPEDWPAYTQFLEDYYRRDNPPSPPGREVYNETIRLESEADVMTETAIDLSQALEGESGHLVVLVSPTRALFSDEDEIRRRTVKTWVQVTELGLDAFVDQDEMIAWVSQLDDGSPLSGIPVSLHPNGDQSTTGADGLATMELSPNGTTMLIAERGSDRAFLPHSDSYWRGDGWQRQPVRDAVAWHVYDDRQMYRPGEEVHIKGWLRRYGGGPTGDIGLLNDAVSGVSYQLVGPQGNELLSGRADVNALGGFDLDFTLPESVNLGYANLSLSAQGNVSGMDGRSYGHRFQIQEFRRPEFEVTAQNETTGPYFVGDHAIVSTSANYFAGGPLSNAEVNWGVTSSPSFYSPPNWPDFSFGIWTPWWIEYEPFYFYESEAFIEPVEEPRYESFSGVTDSAGNHYLRIDFEALSEPQPVSVLAEATVMDVNRQAWAATTSLLVHPANLYVGLRSERTFVERGEPMDIELIVTDLDGDPVSGKDVEVRAARQEWRYNQGRWREEAVDVELCTVTSAAEPVTCTFSTNQGGSYVITAIVTDDQGRLNQSQITRWVSGGNRPTSRRVEKEQVTLIPDKEAYQPGDVAEILVQAPFSPAEGLLSVTRSGLLYTERFEVEGNSHTLRIPIRDEHIPNLNIQVDLLGAAPRSNDQGDVVEGVPPRPAYAGGSLNLNIPPHRRTLSLDVNPADNELEPGGETSVEVILRDADGRPVAGAEVAVVVVDEAILALTNYQLADPIHSFYTNRPSLLSSYYGRANIVLANPELLASELQAVEAEEMAEDMVFEEAAMAPAPTEEMGEMEMAADSALRAGAVADTSPISVRTNFNPLANFSPEAQTDSDGRAVVPVTLPDNLTRYRIMAVAVAGDNQFGAAESNLTARLPLMVRPSAPRFLNFGDRFELPVVLQNQTDEPLEVETVVQAGNVELTDTAGRRVTVPANDRIEVRFPATTESAGTARFQIAAVSGPYADAAAVELPVYTPATTEAFATYGVVDEGAVAQPVASPENVFPQFGGLEITTSSTALQALTDAVLYLVSYRYECSEQLASRILAIAALRDVLTAFSADGLPTPEEMEAAVARDIDRLRGMQNNDGGFPVWERTRESIPFYSIHVAHALQRAKDKGFDVPADMQGRVLDYLTFIEDYYPYWYSERTRQTLSAYALYVRHLMGDTDRDKARGLYHEAGIEDLSLEAVAWLWQVLNDDPGSAAELEEIQRHINNRAVETAGAANFTVSYGEEAYLLLHSNRRTDGIILDALINGQPNSDLIPKVVNGLLAHRTKGRWDNTQENVFILLALDRYFNTFETQTPDFVASIWLGDTYAGSHEYVGRTTERHETNIPMAYLTDLGLDGADSQDLILSKEGPGRLYYRLGMSYAPTDLDLDPLDMGFVVQRSYEAVDDPDDVSRDADGTWRIKAGARVRVRLTMVADNRRYHVALVDPLPAGLEIVNPALAVSGDIPQDPNDSASRYGWWWWRTWYEHQNMRDERAEAFATLLWEGVHNYSYLARATTPGEFVVPPAKAEEMYSPEVFGRSGSDSVIVE